jgi:predicted ferric reductase
MKKWILVGVLALFIAIPIIFWMPRFLAVSDLTDYPCAIGRIFALVGMVLVLFQITLSSRLPWLERNLGLDKLLGVHRTAGVTGFAFMLSHPFLHFSSDLLALGTVILKWPMIIGLTALLVVIATAGSSILYGRLHLKYGVWKKMHWLNFILLPVIFTHSLLLGSDLGSQPPLLVFWLFLGALYVFLVAAIIWDRINVRRHPFQVTEVVQETPDIWSIHFKGRPVDYKPGQFAILSLLRPGLAPEPHPFTVASSPTSGDLAISIKAVGDFTSTIKNTSNTDQAYISVPYGTFSFLDHDARNLVFIAGGIGITPFMSMLRYMVDKKLERNVLLLWGNKTERDIAFRGELEQMAAAMPTLRIIHVISNQPDWSGEKGYIDGSLLHKYLDGFGNPQIFVCGPPVMMTKVIRLLRQFDVPKAHIHYERFALQ